jgi:hypothetical protein
MGLLSEILDAVAFESEGFDNRHIKEVHPHVVEHEQLVLMR